jgi:hypothetical protein
METLKVRFQLSSSYILIEQSFKPDNAQQSPPTKSGNGFIALVYPSRMSNHNNPFLPQLCVYDMLLCVVRIISSLSTMFKLRSTTEQTSALVFL